MSETKHTPGNWRAEQGGIDGDEQERWCVVTTKPDDPDKSWFVATIENGAPGDTLKTEAANAHLLAAAKELMEACQELTAAVKSWLSMRECECEGGHHCGRQLREAELKRGLSAIAKALGKASL